MPNSWVAMIAPLLVPVLGIQGQAQNGAKDSAQKHQVRIAGVFDVVTRDGRHKTDVIGVEVHRARSFTGKDCHAPLTGEVVLPFGSVWMPMQFAHTTRLNDDQGCRDVFRRPEVA
jgi:hypothetical protein